MINSGKRYAVLRDRVTLLGLARQKALAAQLAEFPAYVQIPRVKSLHIAVSLMFFCVLAEQSQQDDQNGQDSCGGSRKQVAGLRSSIAKQE